MTKAAQVNLFDLTPSNPPQPTPNEELAQIQTRMEELFCKSEASNTLSQMKNSPHYQPLSREDWEKSQQETFGFHLFMMAKSSRHSSQN